jgi:sensor histidine kinase YesM
MGMDLEKQTERKITFIVIAILILMSTVGISIYYYKGLIVKDELFYYIVSSLSTNGLATYFLFIGNFKIDRILEKHFPWSISTIKRLILEYVLIITYSLCVMAIIGFCLKTTFNVQEENYFFILLKQTFIIVVIITTGITFTGFVRAWKTAQVNIQKLEKETANARYESLKANIKPHFLFNSLNTLSSLIRINPVLAEEYSSGLSDVYRYILKSNEDILVSVKEEVKFLETYLNLQKIRFGDNLEYIIDIEQNILNKYIPSLSLQLIVENALKHNIINQENKLRIAIQTNNNWLVIINNFQPKHGKPKSNGFGLTNITERYNYFTDEIPTFEKSDKEYIVKIPLLNE